MSNYKYPYVYRGDFLRLNATSTDASATLTINGRILTDEGDVLPFSQSMVITGAGDQTPVTIPLPRGWIMGFAVFVSAGTITDGEVIASVDVVQASGAGLTRIMGLASGEVTNTRILGLGAYLYSGGSAASSQPTVVSLTVANPAAGANFSQTVTAGQVWEVFAIRALLTTSATVAARSFSIVFDDGANFNFRHEAAVSQAASLVYAYNCNPVGVLWTPIALNTYLVPIPPVMLPAGSRIRSIVNNIQVGDQFSEVEILYRQY